MSNMFNEICINEEMLPKYTYFKLHDPAAHKYNSTLEYRRDLVKRQITLCKNNINTLNFDIPFVIDPPLVMAQSRQKVLGIHTTMDNTTQTLILIHAQTCINKYILTHTYI